MLRAPLAALRAGAGAMLAPRRGLCSPASSGKWNLPKNQANYAQLSPLSFLKRVERTYPTKVACVHGSKTFTWKETAVRSRRLASALAQRGIKAGDTVAVMASNTPEMLECHWAIPMLNAVINAINTRLDADTVAFIINHGESDFLIVDTEFGAVVKEAIPKITRPITIIDICDSEAHPNTPSETVGEKDYESFLEEGEETFSYDGPGNPGSEWDAISLSYTSGTTGDPKGVVTHHRGAYLSAMSNVVGWDMGHHPKYLWTLPMFHCNGWTFPWALAAVGGTSVCLRRVSAKNIYDAIADWGVTHLCGAPIVLNLIAYAKKADRRDFSHKVKVMTAASPPSSTTLQSMQEEGFEVLHVYGLTETYGPAVICSWDPDWSELSVREQAKLRARQGVGHHCLEDLQLMDPETMQPIPADGLTRGEVMFRGNMVMKGYLKNPKATEKDFKGGWYHSGDVGVMHPNGYLELKDRSKDIIISGGENISSIEIEEVILMHPAINLAAAVARPDNKWGETPCVFMELREGAHNITEEEMREFCHGHLAGFKMPKTYVFCELPKTSTGKVQKFRLREMAKEMGSL